MQLQRERDELAEQARQSDMAYQGALSSYEEGRDAMQKILGILRQQGITPVFTDDESSD